MNRLYTAITTPFTTDDKIDLQILKSHIKMLLNYGSGVVLFGTTGECPTLKHTERIQIMEFVNRTFSDKLDNFVIGVGGNNTEECSENIFDCHVYAFNTIMITVPYYNRPSQQGIVQHMTTLAQEHYKMTVNSRVILYNVPTRCGVNMEPNTVKQITDLCSNVVALKEASGNLNQVLQIRQLVPKLLLYSGDDNLVIPIMSVGGYGLFSVASNLCPDEMFKIVNYMIENNFRKANEMFFKMFPLIDCMFRETNPVPIKYLLYLKNIYTNPNVRLPLCMMEQKNCDYVKNIFEKY